jgi:TolB protein
MRFYTALTVCVLIFLVGFLLASPASAQREVELGIKSTYANLIGLSIAPFTALDGARPDQATTLEQLISADLEFAGVFKVTRGRVSRTGGAGDNGVVEIRGLLKRDGTETHFEGLVVDASNNLTIGGKRYLLKPEQIRQVAHLFSDEVVRMLTGEGGVATTRITYRVKKGDSYEIVMTDYDGYNPRVLLRQNIPVIYPRWIDDRKAMVFTSFRGGETDLYIRYLAEPASKQLLSYPGLNYSVDWSQKRKEMLVTLSKDGNPEIYVVDKDGKIKRRLTHNRAIDCSPNWSPSGREVAFTSDRSGTPQIYLMQADGSNVRRLSQAGKYNDSPAWSPKGDRIVFVSRIDGFFQLCTIHPDGSGFRPITSEAVDHEDPRWSPAGRHLVYTEKRKYQNVISIIDIASGGRRILSQGETPDWSVR